MRYLFVSMAVLISISACENDLDEVNRLFSNEETRVEVAKGVELLYSDSAIITMRIRCPVLVRHLDRAKPWQEFPDGVTIEFYDENGSGSGVLRADYATREENANRFAVRKNAVWESGHQERLETEELIWDEVENRVYTNKFVVVRRPGEIIYGHGFESNTAFTRWSIRAIEGRIRADDVTRDFRN